MILDPGQVKPPALLMAQALFARATELAREGRYDAAEAVLAGVAQDKLPATQLLDLLARIRAQQGRIAEAQSLWTEALRADPNNESYREALGRIARHSRTSLRTGVFLIALTALAVLLVFAGAWLGMGRMLREERKAPMVENAPTVKIQLAGLSQSSEGNHVVIHFESGLFSRGAILTSEAKTLLTALGRQLEPHAGRVAVRVIGRTDNLPIGYSPRYPDNRSLALARADTVVRHITQTADLPPSMFSLQGNPGEFLHSNDSPAERLRNRTVEMKISANAK
jgi:type VI secretion system protein ImpK